jgi:hypothetical protein
MNGFPVDLLFLLYIFIMGIIMGLLLPKMYKKFNLKFPKIKFKFSNKRLCHCGLTNAPPYCDKSHPFAFRCFRWWRWINENLDERDKGL